MTLLDVDPNPFVSFFGSFLQGLTLDDGDEDARGIASAGPQPPFRA
jgi:hypothetical protein